jgi:hypothetical protein
MCDISPILQDTYRNISVALVVANVAWDSISVKIVLLYLRDFTDSRNIYLVFEDLYTTSDDEWHR